MSKEVIPIEIIENKIYFIRGCKVMLDQDLAVLYNTETRIINRNVKRNIERFPDEFMFQLTNEEWEVLISQSGISNKTRGGRRFNPYVFTEHGILMLSNVLNSERAIRVSIQIIKTFNKLRKFISTYQELSDSLKELELKYTEHDEQIKCIFQALQQLIEAPEGLKKPIGFRMN